MFVIIHLSLTENGNYQSLPTDYDPLTKNEAWEIVTELTNDAISESLPDRWTIVEIRTN